MATRKKGHEQMTTFRIKVNIQSNQKGHKRKTNVIHKEVKEI